MSKYARLPAPDQHGNYWFGKHGGGDDPAILPIKSNKAQWGQYMLSLGDRMLWDPTNLTKLMGFKTPDEALRALQNLQR